MENKELIGKQVKGFSFRGRNYLPYVTLMDKNIGVIGTIDYYHKHNNCFDLSFGNETWQYPAELIEQHLVEEPPFDEKAYLEKSNKESLNDAVLDGIKECVEDLKGIEIKTPDYYDNSKGYDVIDIANDYKLNFNRGSALKYICRAGKKDNEIQDLKKAIDFIQREIQYLELKNK